MVRLRFCRTLLLFPTCFEIGGSCSALSRVGEVEIYFSSFVFADLDSTLNVRLAIN